MPFQKVLPYLLGLFVFVLGFMLGKPAVTAFDQALYPTLFPIAKSSPIAENSPTPTDVPSAPTPSLASSLTPSPSLRSTSTPKASAQKPVTKVSAAPKFTCPGVTYNGQCLPQTCIDLDAPGWRGTDGNQYSTKSKVLWVDQDKKQQQNEDFCAENGNLVEYFCVEEEGQLFPIAINVTDSQCQDGRTAN